MSCPDCLTGGLLPAEPTGSISTQGAYLAPAPADSTETSKGAICLLTDAFGLGLKNCKILADNLAKELNCDLWVPDYFAGNPSILPYKVLLQVVTDEMFVSPRKAMGIPRFPFHYAGPRWGPHDDRRMAEILFLI